MICLLVTNMYLWVIEHIIINKPEASKRKLFDVRVSNFTFDCTCTIISERDHNIWHDFFVTGEIMCTRCWLIA